MNMAENSTSKKDLKIVKSLWQMVTVCKLCKPRQLNEAKETPRWGNPGILSRLNLRAIEGLILSEVGLLYQPDGLITNATGLAIESCSVWVESVTGCWNLRRSPAYPWQ
mgnify:CR=1 FL=1|jgi:hypothetical protein